MKLIAFIHFHTFVFKFASLILWYRWNNCWNCYI